MSIPTPASGSKLTGGAPLLDEVEFDSERIEQKKRKYSEGLYNYTKRQWEGVRNDIERRFSTGSAGSGSSIRSFSEANQSPINDAAELLGAVPAVH